MKLNRTGSNWTELERNKINENWSIIEGLGDSFGKVVTGLVWKTPVDTVADLPTNAEVGETRMVREADPDGISYVYRYDGEKWEKIQAIDVTLVNEVDRRLTRQLADTEQRKADKSYVENIKQQINNDITNIDGKKANKSNVDVIQNQIDSLVINSGESNAEVVQARGGHKTLRGKENEQDQNMIINRELLTSDKKSVAYKGYYNPDGTFGEGEGWFHFFVDNGSIKDWLFEFPYEISARVMQWDSEDKPITRSTTSTGKFSVNEDCTRFAIVVRLEWSSPASSAITPVQSEDDLYKIVIRHDKGLVQQVDKLANDFKNNITDVVVFKDDKQATSDELVKDKLFNWPDGDYTPNAPNWYSYELTNLPLEPKKYEVSASENGRIRLLKYIDDEYVGNEIIYTNEPFELNETINRFAISIQAENADPTSSNVDVFADIGSIKLLKYTPQYANLKELIDIDKTKTFKALMIGNSFADDTARWIGDICKSVDINTIIGVVEIGGGSLEEHWSNVDNNSDAPFHVYENGNKSSKQNLKYNEIISYDDWDTITFQQTSALSGMYDTFQPYLNNLVTYAKSNATYKDVNIGWLMTWAYSTDSERVGFANYNNDQMEMYEAIVDATQKAMEEVDLDIVVPVGTSIQNARTNSYLNSVGDELTRDDYHLDYGIGRYVAALTVFETLVSPVYKKDTISDVTFYPKNDGGTKFLSYLAKVAAKNAAINPFKITKL